MVEALRADAKELPAEDRAAVRSLADGLEDEVNDGDSDADRIEGMVSRAARYASAIGVVMSSTDKVFQSLGLR